MRTARADGPKIWKWTMMPPALKPPTHTHHAWDHAHTHSVNVAIISLSVNITSLNATWRTHTNCHRQTDWSVSRCLITTGTEADRQAVKSDGQTVSRRRANCIYACFFLPRTGTFSCTLHTHTQWLLGCLGDQHVPFQHKNRLYREQGHGWRFSSDTVTSQVRCIFVQQLPKMEKDGEAKLLS